MTDHATLEALLARVLEGEGPDRELDGEIGAALRVLPTNAVGLKGKMMNSLTKQQCEWPDPARPGWPLHPERPGKHWLRSPGGEIYLSVWYVTANPNHSFWEKGPGWSSPEANARSGWTYLGPALTPDEVAKREDAKWHEGYAVGVLDVRRGTAFGEPDPHYASLQKHVAELEGVLRDLMLPQTPASFAGSMRRAREKLAQSSRKDEPFS
jgi:hypothetical protein